MLKKNCSLKCKWNLLHTVIVSRVYYVQESGYIPHQKAPNSSILSPSPQKLHLILSISEWMAYYIHFSQFTGHGILFYCLLVTCVFRCVHQPFILLALLYWLKLLRNSWVPDNRILKYLKINRHWILQWICLTKKIITSISTRVYKEPTEECMINFIQRFYM